MSVREFFCDVDDFCRHFEPFWHKQLVTSGSSRRNRARELALSEIMTILILFHQSHERNFKAFYINCVSQHLPGEFPALVSYTRFVEFFPSALVPLCVSALAVRRVYWRVVCGRNQTCGVPQSAHTWASGVCWSGRAWQNK